MRPGPFFDATTFGKFVPWLMLDRQGSTALVHPATRDERRDHLGTAVEVELPREPNTQPTMAP